MFRFKYSTLCLAGLATVFFITSKIIFDRVYLTSQIIVDEEFHLPIGKSYCNFEYDQWHPKVTTLPGLYILSSLIFGPWELCSIYWLRFTSLIFSCLNIFLFYSLLSQNNDDPAWKNIVSALNLALLPPLYFFSHFYYTDVPSLSMILLLFIFAQKGNHYLASIFGFFAVLFRQTNIIWVGMVLACYTLKEFNSIYHQKKSKRISIKDVTYRELIELPKIFKGNLWLVLKKTSLNFWLNWFCYGALLVVFAIFTVANGGIVVGDRSAHEATLHLPQIFYFALFTLFFAWFHFYREIFSFVAFTKRRFVLLLLLVLTGLVVVHFNTLVHPYMLADNRHYVFYIWNRFYGKYTLFKYVMVPVYLFALYAIVMKLASRRDVSFLLFLIPCTAVVLVTQKLLEFRYFFVPFVLFRAHVRGASLHALLYEFHVFLLINMFAFYTFFTKNIFWRDYDYAQKLIW